MKKILLFLLMHSLLFSSEKMSVEEKVAQTLMVHFHGEEVNKEAIALVQDLKVGGIIYYNWANGLHSQEQVQKLSSDLQKHSKIPLLIAVDQEGGAFSRLVTGFTEFPGNRALAMTGDRKLAKECAMATGKELLSCGVNMNLAPDIDITPQTPSAIGVRSFGSQVSDVIDFGQSVLEGFSDAGILTSIKHFPGLGALSLDSHEGLPVLNKTAQEMFKHELLPFQMLSSQADTLMSAHVIVPAFDAKNCATLSQTLLQDIVRKKFGFEGVIISDSLVMEGFLKNCSSLEEGAICAFNAGCDILLLGGKQLIGAHENLELTLQGVQKIHQALCQAVHEGRISEKKLNESVDRILKMKGKLNQRAPLFTQKEHQNLSVKASSLALHVIKNGSPSLAGKKIYFQAPEKLEATILKTTLPKKSSLEEAEVILAFSSNAWKDLEQREKINDLIETGKPVILVCCNDPQDAALFEKAETILATLSPTLPSLQAAIDLIFRSSEMSKAPVTTVIFETTLGNFEVKLFPDKAPKTCENFLGLVEKKYYEGVIFHRIIKDFMIQGGDPTGTGMGGESIWGKKFNDEFSPTLKFDRKGLLAMANAGPNTNGSQFFITTVETSWLNNKHTIFGEVVSGYDVIEKMENVDTDARDKPITPIKIKKISVKPIIKPAA